MCDVDSTTVAFVEDSEKKEETNVTQREQVKKL